MKFSFGISSKLKTKHTILFVCIQNAGRSQMAEGFFRRYAPEGYEPLSAGTKPTSEINPIAIQAMKEVGIDISKQRPKDMTEDMMRNSTQDCEYNLASSPGGTLTFQIWSYKML